MSRNCNAYLRTKLLGNLVCNFIGYGRILLRAVFQLFLVIFLGKKGILFGNGAFCHCKNGETLASFRSLLDSCNYLLNVVWDFRNQDNICSAGNSCVQSKASYLVSHNFYDKYTAMGCCCCMNAVDSVCCNIYCTLEPECHICTPDIIVDGLRQMDDIQTFFS